MRQYITFVIKEFRHIIRDKRTMLILLGIPVIQILLFGFAITTDLSSTRVAVFDPSTDVCTEYIKNRFNASEYFEIAENITDTDRINDAFKSGDVGLVIVFGENFASNLLQNGEAAIQLIMDGTEPNQASMIGNYAMNILAMAQADLLAESGRADASMRIVPSLKMLYNPQSESSYNFVPGVMGLILMLICAMMTSIAIVREKETGTMEVLLASPLHPMCIILAKATPYFALSCVNLMTILLLAVFVLDVPIAGSLALLIAVSMLFILLALSLGLLISNVVNSQMAAMLVSGMGLMMPVMLLSGLIFPIESMPEILQYISAVVPARWYIDAIRKIMIQGVGFQSVAFDVEILSIMTIVLMSVSLLKFKKRLE